MSNPRITWLGHSTVALDVDGVRVLTDPLLRRHNWPLRRRGGEKPDRERWSDPDVVLLSHLHSDHAQLASLRMVADAPILTAPENADWLHRRGLPSGHGIGDDWWPVGDTGLEVLLVRADHGHRPMPHRPNATNGHLVRSPGLVTWFAGDTSWYDEMTHLPDLAGRPIDLAVVPIGGWGSRLSGGHMDAAAAARACAAVGARQALAVHWGTLHVPFLSRLPREWMDAPGEEFGEALEQASPGCRRVDLVPGESAELS